MSLKDYLIGIFRRSKKEKIDPEDIVEKDSRKPSGTILINYYGDNGDFTVGSDISDLSENSSEMLALLFMHIGSPEFQPFLLESLRVWASDNDEKIEFNVNTTIQLTALENMVMDLPDTSANSKVNSEDPAVRATSVFGFKDMH